MRRDNLSSGKESLTCLASTFLSAKEEIELGNTEVDFFLPFIFGILIFRHPLFASVTEQRINHQHNQLKRRYQSSCLQGQQLVQLKLRFATYTRIQGI